MVVSIAGVATALPEEMVLQETAIAYAQQLCGETDRQRKVISELYRRTNIRSRGSVLANEEARNRFLQAAASRSTSEGAPCGPGTGERMDQYAETVIPLAVRAASAAVARSAIDPQDIGHLVTVTCTGFFAPGFDVALIKRLPLSPAVARTQVGFMGCHGLMNALRVAHAINNANPSTNVLLCAAEVCSLHFQYGWGANNLVANSLFADGAAAIVISANSSTTGWKLIDSASFIVPESEHAMTWKIGNNGFLMTLSSDVPSQISHHLPGWLHSWLGGHGLRVDDCKNWIVHPGGPRILDAVEECLNLPTDALLYSRSVLAECGNMSSPSIMFVFERLQEKTGPCVILGFGPGLAIEAALLWR